MFSGVHRDRRQVGHEKQVGPLLRVLILERRFVSLAPDCGRYPADAGPRVGILKFFDTLPMQIRKVRTNRIVRQLRTMFYVFVSARGSPGIDKSLVKICPQGPDLDRSVALAQQLQDMAKVKVRSGVGRIALDRLAEHGCGFIQVAG